MNITEPNRPTDTGKQSSRWSFFVSSIFFLFVAGVLLFGWLLTPKSATAYPVTLEIKSGMSVRNIAHEAKVRGLVRSELMLYSILTALHDPTAIHAGRYVFNQPQSVFAVAEKIASQEVDESLVTLTIPEGMRVSQVADLAASVLSEFNTEAYIALATPEEGYLFPETYYVPEAFDAESLYTLQRDTFAEVVGTLLATATTTLTEAEVITLASIIEREANDETSMKMVSGILQNRLEIGMALQADAAIEYALDTPINELQEGELATLIRELDSPYNTYKYPGLPPTPIGNPGKLAITAALQPTESNNFYYLTGTDGNFYYARTLDEHNDNVAKYLR